MDAGGEAEERQQLLGSEEGKGSEDERRTAPPHLPPQPAPLQSIPLHPLPPLPIPNEAPPDYHMDLPPYSQAVGIPIQLQVEGRTVSATLVQEPQGKHMVYITDNPEGQKPPPPNDFIFLALLGLLCCCFPLAIVALLRSLEVQRLYGQGDYQGALKASRQAQSWGMASVIFGLCIFVLPVIMRLYFMHTHHYHQYYNY